MFIINARPWRRFILLCLLLVLAIYLLQAKWVWRIFYPWPYRAEITAAAREYGIDPYLLTALIKSESRFNPEATSAVGAVGLMQVMPDTAVWVAKEAGITDYSRDNLSRPEINLAIGSWYLNHLFVIFKGNQTAGLAAYNAGRGKVEGWISSGRWDGSANHLDQIPYRETAVYVKNVLRDYERYKYLYSGSD